MASSSCAARTTLAWGAALMRLPSRRTIATVSDMLSRKRASPAELTIKASSPLREAVLRTAASSAEMLLVVDDAHGGGVVGVMTAHDILRHMKRALVSSSSPPSSSSSRPPTAASEGMARVLDSVAVREIMTPAPSVVHCRPTDTASEVGTLMSELHITHLPVLDPGATGGAVPSVVGVVTMEDVANVFFEGNKGGKDATVKRILPRKGLRPGTPLRLTTTTAVTAAAAAGAGTPPHHGSSHAAHAHSIPGAGSPSAASLGRRREHSLFLRTGAAAAPHARPAFQHDTPSEDAYFVAHLCWPAQASSSAATAAAAAAEAEAVSFIGLADGVGSWRGVGVDPRLYATRLMAHAAAVVGERAAAARAAAAASSSSSTSSSATPPPTPMEVLFDAWERVTAEGVVGSSTAAIITLDPGAHQLCVASVGDCGVILLRNTDLGRVGSLLRGGTSAGIRPGWRVSARAMQQLVSFNLPFQLGNDGKGNHSAGGTGASGGGGEGGASGTRFQTPADGESLVLPVQNEDLIIVATDGLFDNLDETDILAIVEAWDREDLERRRAAMPFASSGASTATACSGGAGGSSPPPTGLVLVDGTSKGSEGLALRLARTAREYSLNKMRDGPFAHLAKENDIMWGGGRPDDVTVLVARVTTTTPAARAGAESMRTVSVTPQHDALVPRNAALDLLR
jgi:protein phosphatase PTC7